jgi:hypothetical protein
MSYAHISCAVLGLREAANRAVSPRNPYPAIIHCERT